VALTYIDSIMTKYVNRFMIKLKINENNLYSFQTFLGHIQVV